jgi:hypothetical protein
MRRVAHLGLVGAAVTAVSLTVVPVANAVTWYSSVPTDASNVTTVASESVPDGGTLQIRRGTSGGYTYYWGRLSDPANKYDSDHELYFKFTGIGCTNTGTTSKDVNNTTYTSAGRKNSSCLLMAQLVKRSTEYGVTSVSYDLR